jgi:GR25 family glycosyltransferase involved in LPS biosynthesis
MRDVVSGSGALFLPTFLINLDRSADRLTRMQAEFARAGMDFERFAAVSPHAGRDRVLCQPYRGVEAYHRHGRAGRACLRGRCDAAR